MRLLLAAFTIAAALAGPASAQSEAETGAARTVIQGQIEAFGKDDGAGAWSYAAPGIRALYPTPETFMAMVRKGYAPVYRPKSWSFGTVEQRGDEVAQVVEIVDPEGKDWQALYTIARQPDGTWKITSCRLILSEGRSA